MFFVDCVVPLFALGTLWFLGFSGLRRPRVRGTTGVNCQWQYAESVAVARTSLLLIALVSMAVPAVVRAQTIAFSPSLSPPSPVSNLAPDPCAGRTSGPCLYPRFDSSGLASAGKFTISILDQNGAMIGYGGAAVGVSEDGRYLYVSCHHEATGATARGMIATFQIPQIGGASTLVQPCRGLPGSELTKIDGGAGGYFPLLGSVIQTPDSGVLVGGFITYDAVGSLPRRTWWRGYDVAHLSGPFEGSVRNGLVKGQTGRIPPEWQSMLGGDLFAGAGYSSIVSRASYGAAFTAFWAKDATSDGFPMQFLLGCPERDPVTNAYLAKCSSRWGSPQSPIYYNGAEQSGGAFIVPGTRTLAVIEREADGPTCYGYATRNPADHGKPYLDAVYCYSLSDPLDQKGPMGYPYRLVAKMFDLADLVAVKQGLKKPWDVDPYDVVTLPGSSSGEMIGYTGGGVFNPVRGEYYLTRELYPGAGSRADVTVIRGFPAVGGAYELCGDHVDNDGDGLVDEGCLSPPYNVRADVSGSNVTLSWQSAPGLIGFVLEAGSGPGRTDVVAGSRLGLTNSVSAAGVPRGLYYARVRAISPTDVSLPSSEVVIGVGGAGGAPVVPGVPREFRVTVGGSRTVTMLWGAPTSGGSPTGYVLEAGSAPGLTNIAAGIQLPLTPSFVAPNVPPGAYYLRLRAVNSGGLGPATGDVLVVVH
ncbi:MAG: hypothetical protein AB7O28_06155 [Vicinamibacterales bacterium]